MASNSSSSWSVMSSFSLFCVVACEFCLCLIVVVRLSLSMKVCFSCMDIGTALSREATAAVLGLCTRPLVCVSVLVHSSFFVCCSSLIFGVFFGCVRGSCIFVHGSKACRD